jgi:propionyl-CoA carboxylase alpha chain
MAQLLDEFRIEGISHNIAFLNAIMHSPRFREGRLTTGFIAEEYPDGFQGRAFDGVDTKRFIAAAVVAKLKRTKRASDITGTLNGAHHASNRYTAVLNEKRYAISDAHITEGQLSLKIDDATFSAATNWEIGEPLMHLLEKNGERAFEITRVAGGYKLRQGGAQAIVSVRRPEAASLAALMPKKTAADTSKLLLCPMPGLVVSVNVAEGQEVKTGETLAVVEAMKMENVLTAERDGTIKKINAKKGDSLALDDVILEFA